MSQGMHSKVRAEDVSSVIGTSSPEVIVFMRKIKLDRRSVVSVCIAFFLTYPPLALAYIGPGLGAGAIAVVLGLVVGFLMLVVGVIWYPLKRLFRRIRPKV